jgi:hypothetical protein
MTLLPKPPAQEPALFRKQKPDNKARKRAPALAPGQNPLIPPGFAGRPGSAGMKHKTRISPSYIYIYIYVSSSFFYLRYTKQNKNSNRGLEIAIGSNRE